MTDYLELYPEVSLDLSLSDRVVDLVEDGFDAAIRIADDIDPGLVARPLQPYRMMLCASPAYLARAGMPRTPADLLRHECLDFTPLNRRVRWNLEGHKDSEFPASRFRANNGVALRMAALRGLGIVLQSEALLEEDVAAGRLLPVLADYLPAPRAMALVYPRDRTPTPKMTTLVQFIVERFG